MPLVSVLLATHDDARFLGEAVASVLGQTHRDLELIVVDDASTDETPSLLAGSGDQRLVVLRNDTQLGLASSLNRGLDRARGEYIARLDADDVALPERLARQLELIRATGAAVVGSAVQDLDEHGKRGTVHRMPRSAGAVRWHSLFSSPFFHPTVLADREALGEFRYDATFLESEDYDLWTRLLATGADGANHPDALVLKRVHAGQASFRRRDVQRSFQRDVALREIARVSGAVDAGRAWSFAVGESRRGAAEYRALLAAFERRFGADPEVRTAAAKRLARGGRLVAATRVRRSLSASASQALRVTVVSPEPTPYRAPLFDRIAAREGIALTVVYAAGSVADRTWKVELHHPHAFLRGIRVPGARRLVRHAYPITPGIVAALARTQPDVVVVSGWSTFAAQAAIAWCRARRVPYILLVESHDVGPRPGWRRAVKGAVVPRLVRGAAGALAVGTLAKESLVGRGADPQRVRIFANTIDVEKWIARAERLERRRLGNGVRVLSVGRLVPEKGFDVLAQAASDAGVALTIVGEGPQRLAGADVRGHLDEDALAQEYVDADIFALLSRHEPWGVVVNEAAASGLPLVLSNQVGAGADLLRDGDNGFLVPANDVDAAAHALRTLVDDPDLRARMGKRSRELVRAWGYEPSADAFVAAVRDAITSR